MGKDIEICRQELAQSEEIILNYGYLYKTNKKYFNLDTGNKTLMTKKDFLNLKRQIDKLFEEAENEALKEGVDITSNEFQLILLEIKKGILAKRGISLEEYEGLEGELETGKETQVDRYSLIKLGKGLEQETKEEKEKFQQAIKEIKEESSVKINVLAEDSNNKIQGLAKKTDNETKELLRKIRTLKEQKDISDKQKDKQIEELKERFFKEALRKDREIEDIKEKVDQKIDREQLFEYVTKKDLKQESNKYIKEIPKIFQPAEIEVLKEFATPEFRKKLDAQLNDLTPRGWAAVRWSLQKQIDAMGAAVNFVDDETPTGTIDGSNKTFTLAHTPNPVASLKVYVNGQRQVLTTDYTLSGNTITTIVAYPTGTALRCDYKH